MANYISEDDIEKAILNILKEEPFKYDIICCDPSPDKQEDLNDGTGRTNKKQCVLPQILKSSLQKINPTIDKNIIDDIVKDLSRNFGQSDLNFKNYELYQKIREYIKISVQKQGKESFDFVKLIDFENPKNNTFTAVSQMWIQGITNYRRPDILIFVNGLPLVFIELKNSMVKVEEAYNKNLKSYIHDIPNLFAFNQICVLSNGIQTKLGAFNASYDYFFEWLKVDSEKEVVDRTKFNENNLSVKYFINGLLKKDKLIDYIENFIFFQNKVVKILAKNHQYLGVNNLINNLKKRESLEGKLGVFWHTQGSGKSFSMVMFARKVLRKIEGNWSFLVITDRKELDEQIYKNFVRSDVIGSKEKCRPTNSKELKTMLGKNKRFIFSLIHKFKTDTGKEYPKVSDRNDIIVMVDEAHRTQYKDLAENMRRAVPKANFVAFTGTPLLGAKRLTNQWFGDYVSEYNFKDAVDDGATVPIYYSRRVPKVGLENNFLDDDVLKIVEEENLNEEEIKKLENSTSKILEVIKRDDRLELIAKDIAHHFPRRGFLGKGMVVCVDKFTAVKMYDKVSKYWLEETMNFVRERNKAQTKEERERIGKIIDYMNKVEMCVVISESANEKEEFEKQGLDITRHRKMINDSMLNEKDIEDRFKDVNDPFQLVFVCAMWLTGFDVSNLSTLYLDKPMKGHTLMQAIARVNRVYPKKTCGNIVDYINVFQFMEKALAEYATGNDGSAYPAKNLEQLIDTLNLTIAEAEILLKDLGFNLDAVLKLDALEFSDALAKITDTILLNEEIKEKFKVITNTMVNLYEASKPEIFEMKKVNPKFAPLYSLYKVFHNQYIDDGKIEKAKHKISKLLDSSVVSEDISISQYLLTSEKVIDLSKVDVDKLKKEIKTAKYKAIEIDNLKEFIETTLAKMIKQNTNRIKFSQRYKDIIDKYNAGATETEEYYNMLVNFVKEMKEENQRANLEGLTEEELEIYDLLIKDKKLTKDETQKVKLAAKDLFLKITKEKEDLFVVDWYKDAQPKQKVLNVINEVLDKNLPASYDQQIFSTKANSILSLFIDKTIQGIDIC